MPKDGVTPLPRTAFPQLHEDYPLIVAYQSHGLSKPHQSKVTINIETASLSSLDLQYYFAGKRIDRLKPAYLLFEQTFFVAFLSNRPNMI